jgi:hypothetical protein
MDRYCRYKIIINNKKLNILVDEIRIIFIGKQNKQNTLQRYFTHPTHNYLYSILKRSITKTCFYFTLHIQQSTSLLQKHHTYTYRKII